MSRRVLPRTRCGRFGRRCPLRWQCRDCLRSCCEHACGNKADDYKATCRKCLLDPGWFRCQLAGEK